MVNGVIMFQEGLDFDHTQKNLVLLRTVVDIKSNERLVRRHITVDPYPEKSNKL